MAITSVGYDGQVTEVQWALMIAAVGSADYGVIGIGDWNVVAHPTTAQAVNIAPGSGWGHGVYDTSDSTVTVQCPTISSGTRWDLIAVNRNWQGAGGATTFGYVQGTSAQAMPAYTSDPGNIDNQPLALVQWTAGQTQPTAIVDLRVWAGSGFSVAKDKMALQYLNRLGTEVLIGQVSWRSIITLNNTVDWVPGGTRALAYGGFGGFAEPPNSGGRTEFAIKAITIPDPGFPYQIATHATVEAAGGGSGTRWDVRLEIPFGLAIATSRGDTQAPWYDLSGTTTGPALTGTQTVTLEARKLFGGGNFGLSQFNQFFTVTVIPA
jgi:hypothetical protein